MTKPKVYITRLIPEAALEIIAGACDYRIWPEEGTPVPRDILLQEIPTVAGVFTLLTEKVDEELLRAAPRVKIVANMAVGYDNVDLAAASRHGVMVTNTPGVLTETTADLTFALLLATARRLLEANQYLRQGRWKTWYPMLLTGQDVYGATLGIIGLGRIGEAVARRARGFAMRVLYYNRHRREDLERELGATYRPLDDLLREADFVSIHAPLAPETRHLIGERELALMKPTAVLINTSRGPLVDEQALYLALVQKRIWAAGLDVFEAEPVSLENPLLRLENVVALPHIGSASVATRVKMATTAAINLVAGVTGQRPPHLVNPQGWKG
ncbi:MAG: D-glycerate dehydrogenase [Firmicutes bacterium]|nr:D-glycerate dehydrogenase [Bacillota bacterium]